MLALSRLVRVATGARRLITPLDNCEGIKQVFALVCRGQRFFFMVVGWSELDGINRVRYL